MDKRDVKTFEDYGKGKDTFFLVEDIVRCVTYEAAYPMLSLFLVKWAGFGDWTSIETLEDILFSLDKN